MQIFVIGAHRSGTSSVTGLLNLMGLYLGPEGSLIPALPENPKGFWERRDILELDKEILNSASANWYRVSDFELSKIDDSARLDYQKEIQKIVSSLNEHKPWAVKEPRLSLLFPLWKSFLENPICLHVVRNPLEVAKSLRTRNNFPLSVGLALWEHYLICEIKHLWDVRKIHLLHDELMHDPSSSVVRIFNELKKLGVSGIRMPSPEIIAEFIDPKLHREKASSNSESEVITPAQLKLWQEIRTREIWKKEKPPEISSQSKEILKLFSEKTILDEEKLLLNKEITRQNNNLREKEKELMFYELKLLESKSLSIQENLISQGNTLRQLCTWFEYISGAFLQCLDAKHWRLGKKLSAPDENLTSRLETGIKLTNSYNNWPGLDLKNYLFAIKRELQGLRARQLTEESANALRIQLDLKIAEYLNLSQKLNRLISELAGSTEKLILVSEDLISSKTWHIGARIVEKLKKTVKRNVPVIPWPYELVFFARTFRNWQSANPSYIKTNAGFKENNLGLSVDISDLCIALDDPYRARQQKSKKAVIVAWDLGHNPVGRAFLFCEFLQKTFETTLIGPIFPRYNTAIWEPLQNRGLKIKSIEGANFPLFLERAKDLIKNINADLIIVCKPRIPSLLIGSLLKEKTGASLFLDIDDHELAFFKNQNSLSDIEEFRAQKPDYWIPHSESWTRFAESQIDLADEIIVSNRELQKKFGGTIIPHVRNEYIFDAKLYPRGEIRKRLGYENEDRVILFLGTPRAHKGFLEIAEALKKLNKPTYKLCIIGTILDRETENKLAELDVDLVKNFNNIPFDDLPYILSAADLICLYQNPDSAISNYQMPAKFSDALAMDLPIIASNVAPLKNLEQEGLLTTANSLDQLAEKIEEIFENYEFHKSKARARRKYFLATHSYQSAEKTIHELYAKKNQPKKLALSNFVKKIEQEFPKTHGLELVVFWKQNDSDIYGRRQDMIVKYLSERAEISRIIHFDAPISFAELDKLKKCQDKNNQNGFVCRSTLARIRHESDQGKVVRRTFVFENNEQASQKYIEFLKNEFEKLKLDVQQSIFWFFPIVPYCKEILKNFNPQKVVCDVVDDQTQWLANEEEKRSMLRDYEELFARSSLVYCNTPEVKKRFEAQHSSISVISNAAESFSKEELLDWQIPDEIVSLKSPILGYVGNLDQTRLDLELISSVAEEKKDWQLFFIGSTHRGVELLNLASRHKNIHLLGVKEYRDALKYIRYFDIALIPHRQNEMTQYMNPLKLYNYAAMSKPIVSTEICGLETSYKGLFVAKNKAEFIALIEKNLATLEDYSLDAMETWPSKVEQILKELLQRNEKLPRANS